MDTLFALCTLAGAPRASDDMPVPRVVACLHAWRRSFWAPRRQPTSFFQSFLAGIDNAVRDRVRARWTELGFTEPPPKTTAFHPEAS
jgi:hypothetical protein